MRLPYLFALLFLAVAFLLYACGNKPAAPSNKSVNGSLNFGVLRYDSSALEYRLDSIHNRGLVFQFLQRQPENNNSAFQLIAYAYDTLNDYNNSWMPDTLAVIGDSLPRIFSGKITVGNNEITREQLLNVVRDEQGRRFAYDYVLFAPVEEKVFGHVVYRLTPIKNGQRTGKFLQMTSPMPPTRVWK